MSETAIVSVFISWSKEASRQVAAAIADWMPAVIPNARPWMSDTDIAAGTSWRRELADGLGACQVGVICVTPANVSSQWLAYEAGALSTAAPTGRVIPLLFELRPIDLRMPLANFQSVTADRSGLRNLAAAVNEVLPRPILKEQLDAAFAEQWEGLESRLKHVPVSTAGTKSLGDREILEEILLSLRSALSPLRRDEFHDHQGRYFSYRIRKHLFRITSEDIANMVSADLGLLKEDIDDRLQHIADETLEAELNKVKDLADAELHRRASMDAKVLGTPDLIKLIDSLRRQFSGTEIRTLEEEAAQARLVLAEGERALRAKYGSGPSPS